MPFRNASGNGYWRQIPGRDSLRCIPLHPTENEPQTYRRSFSRTLSNNKPRAKSWFHLLQLLHQNSCLPYPSSFLLLEGPAIYVPGFGKMKLFSHYLVAIITLHAVGRPVGMPGRPGAIETIYPRNLITGQLGDRPESARLRGNI